jgi:hypothetical protein
VLRSAGELVSSAGCDPMSLLGNASEVAPSKPTEPSFDGFVGTVPAESSTTRCLSLQSDPAALVCQRWCGGSYFRSTGSTL